MASNPSDRRKYRRICAPLYCRPAGMGFLARQRQPVNVSMGGVRIYSDEKLGVGQLLKMEFFLPEVPPVTYTAEVAWIDALPEGAPAKFDVGLKFISLDPGAYKLLKEILDRFEDPSGSNDASSDGGEGAANEAGATGRGDPGDGAPGGA